MRCYSTYPDLVASGVNDQVTKPMPVRKRSKNTRLSRVVHPRTIAIDGMNLLRSGSKHTKRHAKIVSRTNFRNAPGETSQSTIRKVVLVDALDVVERLAQGKGGMPSSRLRTQLPARKSAPNPPVVYQIVEASQGDAALDEASHAHSEFLTVPGVTE